MTDQVIRTIVGATPAAGVVNGSLASGQARGDPAQPPPCGSPQGQPASGGVEKPTGPAPERRRMAN